MKTKIGSFSVLVLALLFGLSTVSFSQGEKKPAKTKKTHTTVMKSDSTKAMKSHKKHVKKSKTAMTPEKK